jgi:hypothetical protein
MARKHSSRHHLRPRDLITHQANQTSKPKIILFFFLSKTFGKTFFGKGGGGQTKHHNPKSFVFFLGKLLEKGFWKFLALPGQNMAWYGHGRPRHCRVTHWHAFAFPWHCLGMAVVANATPFAVFSMEALGMAIATYAIALAAHGMPWLGSPWLALPRQPVACLG